MPRSADQITADLDNIRSTLTGLRAGFNSAKPIAESKLGLTTSALLFSTVNKVFEVHESIVLVLADLDERQRELAKQQAAIADGVRDSLRALT